MPIKGLAQMVATLKRIPERFPDEVAAALYKEGQVEMTEAKRRTPVWNPARPVPHGHTPGSLRASGQVHEPERLGKRVTVTLSFGGAAADYAIYVHEDMEAQHATGQAKFLESTLKESEPYLAGRIAARINLKKVVV